MSVHYKQLVPVCLAHEECLPLKNRREKKNIIYVYYSLCMPEAGLMYTNVNAASCQKLEKKGDQFHFVADALMHLSPSPHESQPFFGSRPKGPAVLR